MRASARHILVQTREECVEIKRHIENGEKFEDAASNHSLCPSADRGGMLGEFSPGNMVEEFDNVVFKEAVGVVHGPVQTQFGFHLIEIIHRDEE